MTLDIDTPRARSIRKAIQDLYTLAGSGKPYPFTDTSRRLSKAGRAWGYLEAAYHRATGARYDAEAPLDAKLLDAAASGDMHAVTALLPDHP